jgi:hypothetical protein
VGSERRLLDDERRGDLAIRQARMACDDGQSEKRNHC